MKTEKGKAQFGEWIKSSEKLPEPNTSVIIYESAFDHVGLGDVRHDDSINSDCWFVHNGGYRRTDDYITHWMPLPKPPPESVEVKVRQLTIRKDQALENLDLQYYNKNSPHYKDNERYRWAVNVIMKGYEEDLEKFKNQIL